MAGAGPSIGAACSFGCRGLRHLSGLAFILYLVFATLIIPALAVRRKLRGLLWAYLIGAVGYTAGLAASAYWDLPAGPVIVWALAGAALMWNLMRRHSV
ncbi:MAG: metal ABC transporter permease [Thiogranum sp.]|nr:metal ABC transporter permease [Thiogranum sp.]